MRYYLLSFCLLISIMASAQSVFDENGVSDDDLREIISEVFESLNAQGNLFDA